MYCTTVCSNGTATYVYIAIVQPLIISAAVLYYISDSISHSANSTVTIALLLFIADYSISFVTFIRLQEQYCSAKNTYFISQWQTKANFTLECLLTVVTLYCTDSMHLAE